jgi:hypothetical protein
MKTAVALLKEQILAELRAFIMKAAEVSAQAKSIPKGDMTQERLDSLDAIVFVLQLDGVVRGIRDKSEHLVQLVQSELGVDPKKKG